jgi:hypothetical protein
MTRNILAIVLTCSFAVRATGADFVRPGLLDTKANLEFVKARVAAGEQPWTGALAKMKALKEASLDYKPAPHEEVNCGSGSRPDYGCSDEKRDAQAAYLHALLWVIDDDERHAEKCAEILNAWSILKSHGLSNANLEAGWTGGPFLRAADILKHSYPKWPAADQDAFTAMIRRAFLPNVRAAQRASTNGNWEAVMIETAMSIAVFTDDRKAFDAAVARYNVLLPAYVYGAEDGPTPKTVDSAYYDTRDKIDKHWYGQTVLFDGLCQETGRDLTHAQWGIGGLIHCAEIAWNQGIDLYAQNDNRLLRGMEFHAKYLNGAPVPRDLQNGQLKGVDKICPMWEIGFNHYHGRRKVAMPETEELLNRTRPEVGPDHHLGFGTLTHFGTADATAKR